MVNNVGSEESHNGIEVRNTYSQCAHIHFLLVPYLENPPKCKLVHETDITKIKQFDWFISLLFISKYGTYEFEYFHTFDEKRYGSYSFQSL